MTPEETYDFLASRISLIRLLGVSFRAHGRLVRRRWQADKNLLGVHMRKTAVERKRDAEIFARYGYATRGDATP